MASASILVSLATGVSQAADTPQVIVHKTPTCGCCTKWVDHLRAQGLSVEVVTVNSTRAIQADAGVPRELGSCHTAVVGEYFVEGHVPADLVQKLINEQPEGIRGIAVPGMPAGSPGMESPRPVAYDIIAVATDGQLLRYATRMGKSAE